VPFSLENYRTGGGWSVVEKKPMYDTGDWMGYNIYKMLRGRR